MSEARGDPSAEHPSDPTGIASIDDTGRSSTSDDSIGSSITPSFYSRTPTSSKASSHSSLATNPVNQWGAHVSLTRFTENLGSALRAGGGIFPNGRPRYKRVHVLLMRWEIGDPMLPVVVEMQQLQRVLEDVFHYEVQVFEIPVFRCLSLVVWWFVVFFVFFVVFLVVLLF